jgi:hypothetical protein
MKLRWRCLGGRPAQLVMRGVRSRTRTHPRPPRTRTAIGARADMTLIECHSAAARALQECAGDGSGRLENMMETLRIWPEVATWISSRLAIVAAVLIAVGLWYAAISFVL